MATSNELDLQLLKVVTSQLDGLVGLSASIAKLQMLFQSFIGLCGGIVQETVRESSLAPSVQAQMQLSSLEATHDVDPGLQQLVNSQTNFSTVTLPEQFAWTQTTQFAMDETIDGSGSNMTELGWGLFDTQPTLGWLDADFSIFDNV